MLNQVIANLSNANGSVSLVITAGAIVIGIIVVGLFLSSIRRF